MDAQRGIRKPRQLSAALSIRTVYRPECKIHHAAYDSGILGIRPDKVVEIRTDLLSEIDGPMLQHGLKERHGQPLMALPRIRKEQPDPLLLEVSYERFRAAG